MSKIEYRRRDDGRFEALVDGRVGFVHVNEDAVRAWAKSKAPPAEDYQRDRKTARACGYRVKIW